MSFGFYCLRNNCSAAANQPANSAPFLIEVFENRGRFTHPEFPFP